MNRPDLPPPGPPLDFLTFAKRVNGLLRADLPEIKTTRSGDPVRVVRWRYGGRTATLTDQGAAFSFTFESEAGRGGNMASLYAGDRKDDFVACNLAKSVAVFFDAKFSRERG